MKTAFHTFYIFIMVMTFFLITKKGMSQPDVNRIEAAPADTLNIMFAGGIVTDFAGFGGLADFTLFYRKHVFGLSYGGMFAGKVVTNRSTNTFLWTSTDETSYPADERQIYSLSYGRRIGSSISITAGIAWVMEAHRDAVNGHSVKEGGWFTSDVYQADLVQQENAYPAIPITIKYYAKISSWCGMELHAQAILSDQNAWFNAGISFGLGNFPGSAPRQTSTVYQGND